MFYLENNMCGINDDNLCDVDDIGLFVETGDYNYLKI